MLTEVQMEYKDRVKHLYSPYTTNEEELQWAETIMEPAERMEITTSSDDEGPVSTEVVVMTTEGVYHFQTFRSYYVGHSSRTLVNLLAHFGVFLPLDFVVETQTFTVYVDGLRIVDKDNRDYALAHRDNALYLVEPVEWSVKSETIHLINEWSEKYHLTPETVVEMVVSLVAESGANRLVEHENDTES